VSLVRLLSLGQLLLFDNAVDLGLKTAIPEVTRIVINVLHYALCRLMEFTFSCVKRPFDGIWFVVDQSLGYHPAAAINICTSRSTLSPLAESRVNEVVWQYRR